MKTYFIKVQINTPKGYKNKTMKGVCIANNPKEASDSTIECVVSELQKNNPGLAISATVKGITVCDDFVINTKKQGK